MLYTLVRYLLRLIIFCFMHRLFIIMELDMLGGEITSLLGYTTSMDLYRHPMSEVGYGHKFRHMPNHLVQKGLKRMHLPT